MSQDFQNPFRPGAGHQPPYLAGREVEIQEFRKLLQQNVILENLILTGLRGVGKTVLLDNLKPIALQEGWHWVGSDLSESASLTEDRIALRLLTDLSVVTSSLVITESISHGTGFNAKEKSSEIKLHFNVLAEIYENTPGLPSDKLKYVLEVTWSAMQNQSSKGLVFAYDEAQNLSDNASRDEYPSSLLLDVFQTLQKRGIPFMLVLTGLPTLFAKLLESRTFAERMFRVLFLDKLSEDASKDAIVKPIQAANCPVQISDDSVDMIIKISGCYPYFIQFICREAYDAYLQGQKQVPVDEILRKLDTDFFSGRWSRATDRQKELLSVIAKLENAGTEFTVHEIAEKSKEILEKPFSSSSINQMLTNLIDSSLIYKNRHGKYSFAVPLINQFILRQGK